MRFHKNLFILFILVCLTSLISVGFAQVGTVSADSGETSSLSFPYIAEITGDDVHIRSGAGTNHYSCGKLNKNEKVKVVGSKFSWSRIVPPAGSFSWISKQYVKIDPNNPTIGIVTGNDVRIYAGSGYQEPIHSTAVQTKFNTGEQVRLLGEEKDDYYKIVPPASAYLWVLSEYTKPLGPVGQVQLTESPEAPAAVEAAAVVPASGSVESDKIREYYVLEEQVKAQLSKPISRQDYTAIKKALVDIAGDKEAGKAVRYCEFTIKQIERFELASEVDKAVRLQDAQLQQVKDRIEKACMMKLAEIPQLGSFIAIGLFEVSNIYGSEPGLLYHRLIDNSGKIVCYTIPGDSAVKMDLNRFVGKKVGLVGTIQPHPQAGGALVKFTEITELMD